MESILQEAERIIEGDREKTYGKFDKNLENIAALWRLYIDMIADDEGTFYLEAKDVAMMMILLKIARETNAHKRDNLVDIAGYASLAAKLEELKDDNSESTGECSESSEEE